MIDRGRDLSPIRRIAGIAARLVLSLALLMAPVAAAAAPGHGAPAATAAAADCGKSDVPNAGHADHAIACNHASTCHPFFGPIVGDPARAPAPSALAIAAATDPPEAAAHRLFRPPRNEIGA